MINIILKVLLSSLILNAGLLADGWVKDPELERSYVFKLSNGDVVGRYLGVPHLTQEKTYTCGPSVIAMQIWWETYKFNRSLGLSADAIYDFANDSELAEDGRDGDGDGVADNKGFNATELKNVIPALANHLNVLGYSNSIKMIENGESVAKNAIENIVGFMNKSKGPVIIYGNLRTKDAGGHYRLAIGSVNYKSINALWMNDPVYKSKIYSTSPKEEYQEFAVSNGMVIDGMSTYKVDDNGVRTGNYSLGSYWKKTGGYGIEILKKHMFLANEKAFG